MCVFTRFKTPVGVEYIYTAHLVQLGPLPARPAVIYYVPCDLVFGTQSYL